MAAHATEPRPAWQSELEAAQAPVLGLAILWSREEPGRVGEVALAPRGADVLAFGRAPEREGTPLVLTRQRAGGSVACPPIQARTISRVQLLVRSGGGHLDVRNVGKLAMLRGGRACSDATLAVGDTIQIGDELVLMVVRRPAVLPELRLPDALVPAFGLADGFGIVGESPAAWELRRQLAFAASRSDHVLITGPSGVGKELVARALHRLSRRAAGPLVARNAATFPDSLIDAELFGNVRDYPNPGMAERPGLVGSADGGTLFLDEIGELSHGLQAHLLRLLDAGEYQRLGEVRSRTARLRLVAATNRSSHELKHDVAARLRLRIAVPGLEQRREDVPLIARQVLREMARHDDELAGRFFHGGDLDGEPRWTGRFVAALAATRFTTHVRELAALLWDAMLHSRSGVLDVGTLPAAPSAEVPRPPARVDPRTIDADRVRAVLEECGGVQEKAWRALGLRSRYQLIRLLRKYEVRAP